MAATVGIIGKGTILSMGTVGGSLTAIAEVTDVKHPEINISKVDFTNYASPNSFMEYLPSGWIEAGDIEADITYATATATTIQSAQGVVKDFKITLPDTHVWTFSGFISKVSGAIPNKDRVNQTITITPTTKPTFA